MQERIGVGALKDTEVLYKGDIYDLACLLPRVHDDVKDRGTKCRSRQTVHGLATTYSMIADVKQNRILEIFERHSLPLGATVEYDEDLD
jgi:hypothetical protein